ncbi:MAG: undecaprenyl/decaprenyl-phosphate alpha-N-acetylglucosaminyl 1-phosphate transferase [Holophagaceae bacterium]|uniref:Undecaprenyl/decaprenyl-phosphate alpha-N-acetylglucosaminyl 1-phosphate transferase n=1 Tax=Candidatus Geothrix skivensis TaxID=2954439 RepID=A0A9D7SJI7_9BACT|nr:undecaprenyl/decaprenyl-phosphate alpha-N-acetylglucosaminyl 1-phosphate transferase [Candidatus Geothrix skivensis]
MPLLQPSTLQSLFIGLAVALGLSLVCIRWVAPRGWLDHPDPRKHHHAPTPRTAGLALWLLVLGLLALGRCPLPLDRVEWAAVHAMAFIGLLDDRLDLRSRYKALVGLAVALVLAVDLAPELAPLTREVHFLGLALPNHPLVTIPLLAAWFWAIPQAFNLIDGVNGLSMGFSLLVLTVLAAVLGQAPAGGYLTGGLLAVLLLNYPRARHFLGDCGSLLLGTLFAVLAAKAFAAKDANLMLWVFAYPAVDVSLVVAVRTWKRVPLGSADRSHLHHYLVDRLGRHRTWQVPLILLGLALLPMTRALSFPGHRAIALLGLAVLVFLAMRAFRDRVDPIKAVLPLRPRKELDETSGPNQVA